MPEETDENGNIINPVEERIKSLSSKVKTASEERDAAKTAQEAAEVAKQSAEKERDFYASFADSVTKYPAASEFRDKIKDKVLAGYSPEDATVSVLNAEGKLTPTVEPAPVAAPAAGGSAVNQLPDFSNKTAAEMTQVERRAALVEAEKRGDIGLT